MGSFKIQTNYYVQKSDNLVKSFSQTGDDINLKLLVVEGIQIQNSDKTISLFSSCLLCSQKPFLCPPLLNILMLCFMCSQLHNLCSSILSSVEQILHQKENQTSPNLLSDFSLETHLQFQQQTQQMAQLLCCPLPLYCFLRNTENECQMTGSLKDVR